MRVCKK